MNYIYILLTLITFPITILYIVGGCDSINNIYISIHLLFTIQFHAVDNKYNHFVFVYPHKSHFQLKNTKLTTIREIK